jgi:hypothetical protein
VLRSLPATIVVLGFLAGEAGAQPTPPSPPGTSPLDDAERVLDAAAAHFETARQARDLLRLARELAYADPRQVEWALASAYGELMADPVMGPLLSNLVAQYRGGFVRVDVDAGAGSDVAMPASASGSVAASYELPLCRVAGVRAAGLGGWDGEAFGSYVLTGSACLPLPANTLEFAYTRRGNVRTSLMAVPMIVDDRRSGDVYDFLIRFYRWRGASHQIDVMPMLIHIDVGRDGDAFAAITSSVDGAPAVWRRRGKGLAGEDQVWRFMSFALRYQDDDAAIGGRDAGAFTLLPVSVEGAHVTPDVVASVGGGFVRAAGMMSDATVVEQVGAVAHLQVEGVRGPARVSVRGARDYVPTYDAQIILDDRLSTRVDVAHRKIAAGLAMFAARQQVLRDTGEVDPELVTGGALDAAYVLGGGFHLLGRVEGAHALVAGRAADAPVTAFELRASAGVAWHWDRRWPERGPDRGTVGP